MKKLFLLSVILLNMAFNGVAQETRKEIKDFINTEIILNNGFAGESITLIKEKKNYFIIRKAFGSGIPVVLTIKYSVNFNSKFQIDFSEIIESDDSEFKKQCRRKIQNRAS